MINEEAATSQKRILVIEDDPSISWGLQMNLEAEGYQVRVAEDGEAGLELAEEAADLIILDVMLPKLNGLEVLRTLRARGKTMPIIVLSARGAEMDKVVGLELGAEDYITKPFGLAELLARVKAALRRGAIVRPPVHGEIVRAGALEIHRASRQVLRNGAPVTLTATEFDVLWCLISAGGNVRSREEIRAAVWGPSHHGTTRTIDNFLLQLRNKLETDPQEPEHLLTVRGVGYRFQL
jgi:two-component system, OmpR family, alkaline phosphatase synthesis response regulator PhoP